MIARMDVRALPLPDESVDMIFTDPPYLREYLHTYGLLANEAMRVLKPHRFLIVMTGGAYVNQVFRLLDDAGMTFYWEYDYDMTTGSGTGIVWRRSEGRNMPVSTRTKRLIAYSKGSGISNCPTTGRFASDGGNKIWHEWGQDVASARYFVESFTQPGDLVLDPMCGGGTTGVACALIGRRYILGDIDPRAIDITRRRMSGEEQPLDLPLFASVAA